MNDEDAKLLQVEVRIFYTVTTMDGLIIRSPTKANDSKGRNKSVGQISVLRV